MQKEQAYFFNLFTSVLFGLVPVFIMIFLWNAIYQSGGQVSSFSTQEIISYFFASFLISSFVDASGIAIEISRDIRTGNINNLILKPISHCSYMFQKLIGQKLYFLLLMLIPSFLFCILFHWQLSFHLSRIPLFFIAIFTAFILNYLIYYLIGILSFWFLENGGIIQLWRNLTSIISGEKIPLFLFPLCIQHLFFFLPFRYTIYYPISVFIEPEIRGEELLIAWIWIILLYLISLFLWRKGVNLNEGVGI